jgi:hypothetical protein
MVVIVGEALYTLHTLVPRPRWHLVVNGGKWFDKHAAQNSAGLLNACLHQVFIAVLGISALWNEKWLLLSVFFISVCVLERFLEDLFTYINIAESGECIFVVYFIPTSKHNL